MHNSELRLQFISACHQCIRVLTHGLQYAFVIVYYMNTCTDAGVYAEMELLHEVALRRRRTTICGGDWNAVVGQRGD